MRQTAINFFSSDGLTLEGIIAEPSADEVIGGGDAPGVVLCAPEPHLGGTMLSPVIEALVRRITPRGFAALRFNYRGVGDSQGEGAVGEGQVTDVLSAIATVREWPGVNDRQIGLIGYSYGVTAALRAASQQPEGLCALLAVSPLLDIPMIGISTDNALAGVDVPVRFLIGSDDGLTTPERLGEWVDGLGRDDVTALALEGADRAWQDRRAALADAAVSFLEETLAPR